MAATKTTRGQPLKFKSVQELKAKIDSYFDSCYISYVDGNGKEYQKNIRPLTITGLAYDLKCDRDTLLNYSRNEDYFGTIHEAKLRIHIFAEESLWQPKITAGIIFNLKNNWGWKEKTEVETINHNINESIENLTDTELEAEIERYRKDL
jgi:hypothetical protein